jgi:hypothetical protein
MYSMSSVWTHSVERMSNLLFQSTFEQRVHTADARNAGFADKSLARPTYRCILFDGENISFDASLVMYINSTNIPPIMIINRIYELKNVLFNRRHPVVL